MTTSTSFRVFWGLALLTAALRFYALGAGSFQIDEAMSIVGAAQWRQGFQDVHPPLFYGLLEQWARFGLSEFWLRSCSVLASLGSLGLWLRLVRHWRPELAVPCGLMLAVSFAELQQAREVRMYAWLELWTLAYLVAWLEDRRKLAALALLGAVFTHLFGLFLVPLGYFCRKAWSRWVPVVLALWFAWAVPHYLGQRDHPLGLRQTPGLSMGVEAVGRLLSGRIAPFGDSFSIAIGAVALVWLLWRRPACPRLVYAWALLPWLSVWFVSRFTPLQIFEFKYLVWTVPAWIYLLAASLPGRFLLPVWLAINLWGIVPYLQSPHRWLANWRAAAQALRASSQVVCVHPSMMAAPLFCYGVQSRVQLVDEWSQLQPERDMIWVSTPNHPYVVHQHLLVGIRQYWKLEKQLDFSSELPSSEIQVTFWRWGQGPPSGGEKQGR